MTTPSFTLFTDGGARGNPGPAAYGFVLKDANGSVVAKEGKYIGETTNNVAEYQALVAGMRKAKSMKVPALTCYLDSELLVEQLNGRYKIKDEKIQPLFLQVWNLRVEMKGNVTFAHVPRGENSHADELVNEALDQQAMKPKLI